MSSNQIKAKLNLTEDRYKEIKREVVKSILEFLRGEINDDSLDSDQKESLSVAQQCIEASYEFDEATLNAPAKSLVEMFHNLNIPPPPENLAELEAEAERYKVQGNDHMRDGDYTNAVECYSKAIQIFGHKAIYYCNRAAAYSRLEKHKEAVSDCKEAIKLDPTYGKAYGRLGIAYSNMLMYKEAAEAYRKALQLDPTNTTYEANLKLAEEKMTTVPNMPNLSTPGQFDINSFMSNPALLNMASQILSDPSFRNMVSGIMGSGPGGDPNLDSLVEVGQQIADQLYSSNSDVLDNFRATFGVPQRNPSGQPDGSNPDDKKEEPEKKE